tara:strand:- start:6092 stop:6973 length:882 start_codon:yes stop_codon:yes gene_type:complete
MKSWQIQVNTAYKYVFSDSIKKRFEKATLWLSIIGFIIHLSLIYLKRAQLFDFPFEDSLLNDPISAIYTPFSIILVFEIYLLVLNLPRSFTTSVSKQFEIISLILIRRIFADIPKLNLNTDWLTNVANLQLIYDVLGVLALYYLIHLFNKGRLKLPKKPVDANIKRFVSSKKAVSIILLAVLIVISFVSLFGWLNNLFFDQVAVDINNVFFNEFFSILILADVFILLLSFQYTEQYSQLIRNTGFVICTILIRLSFGATALTNVLLIISSVIFGLLILSIYNLIEAPKIKISS